MVKDHTVVNLIRPNEVSFELEGGLIFCHYSSEKFQFSAMAAFPLTSLTEFIFIYKRDEKGGQGKTIGYIERINELDAKNMILLNKVLDQTCTLPKVIEILEIKDEFYSFHIFINTDRGLADFYIASPRKHLVKIGENGLLIHDLQNNYYYIENLNQLSKESIGLLDVII